MCLSRTEVHEYLKKRLDSAFMQTLGTFAGQHQMGIDKCAAFVAALSSPPGFREPSAEEFVQCDLDPLPAYKVLVEFASLLREFYNKSSIYVLWEEHHARVQDENEYIQISPHVIAWRV